VVGDEEGGDESEGEVAELVSEPGVGEGDAAVGVFADKVGFELFEYVEYGDVVHSG